MKSSEGFVRMRTLQGVVLFIFLLMLAAWPISSLSIRNTTKLAKANVLRHVVQYPPRGEVFDRNGEYLVQSRECYDLMVIYSEIDKHGVRYAAHVRRAGAFARETRKRAGQCPDAPPCARVVTNYISKRGQTPFRRVQFPRFLYGLPHRPPLSA